MSRAVARRGGIAESFEIMRDPREDLRRSSQRRALFARIRAGRVAGIWIGITCASWSRARRAPPGSRMPCALRDDGEFILGLPNLSEKDQVKVDDGNDSLVFLCTLIDLSQAQHHDRRRESVYFSALDCPCIGVAHRALRQLSEHRLLRLRRDVAQAYAPDVLGEASHRSPVVVCIEERSLFASWTEARVAYWFRQGWRFQNCCRLA